MRIAFLITRADEIGGAQVHVGDLAEAALRDGHEIAILAGGEGKFSAELARRGLAYTTIAHLLQPISPTADISALFEITAALRAIRPHLISTHTAKSGLLGRLAGALLGCPVVFTPHGWSIGDRISRSKGRLFRAIEYLASPLSARIINVCEYERQLALRLGVGHPGQLEVVYNGIEAPAEEARADAAVTPPTLVMIARMAEPKDHTTLIHALAGLKELPWRLDLIGDGPLESELRVRVSRVGLTDRVRFVGYQPNAAHHLRSAQVFVLTSRSEAFPYSILEAMRAGLPVVASSVGGIPEAVLDGVTGLLAPPKDPEALRRQLARLISDPGMRARLGENGRQRLISEFTFERMYRRTMAIYREVSRSQSPVVKSQRAAVG